MRLTKIQAENLKGLGFEYDLTPAVAIIGPNFAGKSRVVDAIRLALLGYLPELGKTNKATWGLASGSPMSITGIIKPGPTTMFPFPGNVLFQRRFWYLDGTIKDSLQVDPEWGFEGFQANPMLNAGLYFSMTERERTNFVFEAIKLPAELNTAGIVSRLEQISFEEAHSEAIEKAKVEVISRIRKIFEGVSSANMIAACITMAVDELKASFSAANKRQKDTIGTVRVLTELKNREGEFANARGLDEKIKTAQAELDTANRNLGAAENQNEQAAKYNETEGTLRLSGPDSFTEAIDKYDRLIKEARAELVPEPKNVREDLENARNYKAELITKRGRAEQALSSLTKESEKLLANEDCPTCGTPGKSWKKKVKTKYATLMKKEAASIANLDDQIEDAIVRFDKLRGEAESYDAGVRKNHQLKSNIQIWESEREVAKRRQENWKKQLDQLQADLDKMPKVTPIPEEELSVLKGGVLACRASLNDYIDQKAQYQRYQNDVARAATAAIEHSTAKAHLAVVKAVGAELQKIKAEIVDAAFTGLLKTANTIVGNVLKTPLAFYEGEVGRWDGPKFIGHGTFSGTEQALTFVAIATALAQQSPLRILIFDELGRLDYERQHDVTFLLLEALKKDLIDQFIIVGALKPEDVPCKSDLQVIEVQ